MLARNYDLFLDSPVPARPPVRHSAPGWPRCLISGALLLSLLLAAGHALADYPLRFIDSSGREVFVNEKPRRVVSLTPEITEMIVGLGAGDCLMGVTHHDTLPPEYGNRTIVGGFLAPSPSLIASVKPDLVLVPSLHRGILNDCSEKGCAIIELESRSIADLYRNIGFLGSVFDKDAAAAELIDGIRNKLALVCRKVEKIPANRRKRVIRLMGMGEDSPMVPGDDSFQNELIRSAGGIPPRFGKNGQAVFLTMEEWKRFDPEVIYACGGDRKSIDSFLSRPGWNDVRAAREGKIYSFPCNLTCRLSVPAGDFVSWLASTIYDEEFSLDRNRVLEEKTIRTHFLELPLGYVKSARVDETTIFDFTNKTLIVDFLGPMRVISTLEGERKGIASVGNHYFPPPCWAIEFRQGFEKWKAHTLKTIGKSASNSCLLFTGANMKNLSVQKARFKDMTVFALVTAGVESNAMRMSVDEGLFYEPGTINIILLTNRKLTPRAMARAIITATEAKTAAMQDLDIRSSFSPVKSQATGTGTDEVLVVEGAGKLLDDTGGHCKLGELVAKAVYDGVKEAVNRQNGITAQRSIFRRLRERNIAVHGIFRERVCKGEESCSAKYLAEFEQILVEPRYAAFMQSALALTDAHEKGLLSGLDVFQSWCRGIAEEIARRKLDSWIEYFNAEETPVVMRMSLNALLNGLVSRER